MNRKLYILLVPCIALLLMLTQSCESEIPYNGGSVAPKLTMNAFIYTDSPKNKLHLSMTGETAVQSAGESRVEVRVNNELKETLTAIPQTGTRLRTVEITTRFQPGDVVRIDAFTTDGKHHAWIQETVPHPVTIEQIDTSRVAAPPKPYRWADKTLRVKVRFKDRVGEKNYYRIVMEQCHHLQDYSGATVMPVESKDYGYWPWDDLALTDGRPATYEELDSDLFERVTNYYGVFDDSWFPDKEYTLNVQIPVGERTYPQYFYFSHLDLTVRLQCITEAEFYYLTTMNTLDSDILDDYMNDPVKIPSNVQGGNGFVGISSGKEEVFRLAEKAKPRYDESYE